MLGRRNVERHAVRVSVFALRARPFADVLDLPRVSAAALLDPCCGVVDVIDQKTHVMQPFARACVRIPVRVDDCEAHDAIGHHDGDARLTHALHFERLLVEGGSLFHVVD